MSNINNLPSATQERRELIEARQFHSDLSSLYKTKGIHDPNTERELDRFLIHVSYDRATVIDFRAATMQGLAWQVELAIRAARDIGYKQAQQEIRQALGIR